MEERIMSEWTKDEIDFIKENYNKYTKQELSEILGKSKGAIQQKANRMGIKKKSAYFYNKNFFKNICTESQSYWLGFIFADGWITKYAVGIELNKNDDNHLKKFNKDILGNLSISYRTRKPTVIDGRQTGFRNTCCLQINSKEMVDDLISHGCVQNKSLIVKEPIMVPEEYLRHFVRGYFDGNGCIRFDKRELISGRKEYLRVCISTGSNDFATWLSCYLNNKNINNYITRQEKKNNYNVWIVSDSLIDFLNYIYKDSIVHLDRKFAIYKNIINEYKEVV